MGSTSSSKVSIVFAGGGCRTFWSLGLFHKIGYLATDVYEWAGVSAGAAMAITSCVGLTKETLNHFMALADANAKNAYLSNLFRQQPVFPHEAMYRSAIKNVLDGEGFDALKQSAPVRIFLAYIKQDASRLWTTFGAMRAYRRRKKRHIVHGPDQPPRGLGTQTITAQDSETLEDLCEQIITSSSTPPMTRAPVINNCTYVDGGFAENVPVRALSEQARSGKVLVLLTRPIPEEILPNSKTRLYLAPNRPVPISIWDYASPQKLKETFDQGQKDAEEKLNTIEAFLK
ncbi:MAG: patatin-like phospholipase family protein [Proteobacteria bacterium]|nr:patatin-like phospholipase family protein [Pseudomonadota bacterium]